MTAALPVRAGTAERLATLAHFAALDLPDVDRLAFIAFDYLGDVDTYTALWRRIQPAAEHLWCLLTEDWNDDDLDQIADADADRGIGGPAEEELRWQQTHDRLVHEIENAIRLARYSAADTGHAHPAAHIPAHLTGSERRGGGDPLGDYLHAKGEL